MVVPVGIGEVARSDFGSHVVSVEGCKRVNDAPDFERHICQDGQGVPFESKFRKRCVIGVLEQDLFGQMRLFREHIVGVAGPLIPIELPWQKRERALFFWLPSNLEKMRRDGTGVGVTFPFESGVTDQLVIGHSHAVRLPRFTRSKDTDDAFDFSVAKGVTHMGFERFRGASLAVWFVVQQPEVTDFKGAPEVPADAPVAVLPSQARSKLEFPGGVGVGARCLDLLRNCFQSRLTISR